jgi:hypothetical protein
MSRIFIFSLMLILFVGCDKTQPTNSTGTPSPAVQTPLPLPSPELSNGNTTPTPSSTPNNLLNYALARNPEGNILAQAQIIRDRLRYFGEELKTTHKPEKQKALMEDVRTTLRAACNEIDIIIPTTIFYEDPVVNNFLALCKKLDEALATHNPKTLPLVLKDFNTNYANLEARLTKKPEEKEKK